MIETHVGQIELRRMGAGSNVVYLHSAMGEGEGLLLLDELASTFEVFAPMFPGFGASEGIEQIDDMEDVAFHLLDLFDRLHLEQPTVVGLSLGGWIAAELAVRYPERLGGLVLVNPVGLYIKGAEVKDIFGRKLDELADDFFADQSHPMAQMMRMLHDADPASLPFDLVRPVVQTMAATARLGWDPYLHNPKLHKRLWRITVPTLVVRGVHDTLVPRAHAEAYVEAIDGARLVEVEGAAHLLALEKPAELAALIRDFAR
ncbi:MAG TPA: alpha/beta hydrolase [Acidimicrobiales bacterium]|nr:alpha/beta hydrolase [Acidimicrobiales bacterium]